MKPFTTPTAAFAAGLVALFLGARSAPAQCPGVPTFAPTANFVPIGGPVTEIESADMDRDGDLDVVLCNGAQIVVARNNLGVFTPEPPVLSPSNLIDLAVGDFNGDSFPDVAATGTLVMPIGGVQTFQGRAVIFLSNGPGPTITFATPVVYTFGPQAQAGSVGRAIRTADLNADGILDIVATGGSSIWVLLGQGAFGIGDGTFGATNTYFSGGGCEDLALADFNQDGALDLVGVAYGGGTFPSIAPVHAGVIGPGGLPTGAFSLVLQVTIPGPSGALNVETADVDGDGFLDFVVADYNTVVVARGGGGFAFVPIAYPGGIYPVQLAIGDFSGDGLVDFAVARNNVANSGAGGNFSMLVANGAGGYTGYTTLTLNTGLPRCIASGDWNGDGMLDVVVGKSYNGVDVLYSTCAPQSPKTVTVVAPNGGQLFAVGGPANVAWNPSPTVPLVDVEVSRNGGLTWTPVASMLTGTTGSWLMTPPGTANALVRVSASGIPSVADVSDAPFAILGPGAATSVAVGTGCAPAGPPPALAIAPPVLGTVVPVAVTGAGGIHPGGLFASPIPAGPTAVSPGCLVFLDLGALVQIGLFSTDASGFWGTNVSVPSVPAIVGIALRAQAAIVVPASPGYALTNAVELTIGF